MHLIKTVRTGKFSSATKGELIGVAYGDNEIIYGVISQEVERDNVLFVALNARSGSISPHFEFHHRENDCLLFGTDWAFEVANPEAGETFADTRYAHDAGSICLAGDRAVMRVNRSPSNFSSHSGYVDLTDFSVCDGIHANVCVRKWRVWRNVKDASDPHKKPLISFHD